MICKQTQSERALKIYYEQEQRDNVFTDRLFAGLMAIQFAGCILIALFVSPRTWIGAQSSVHIHVWAAVGLGGLLATMPIVLAIRYPGQTLTRHVIAISQMLFSALLIHLMGGRIEAHFHVFGSLAFLAFYRDIRVLITATLVTASDHLIRGLFWPESVFGVFSASNWRWVEHAAWVIFENIFLIISITRIQKQAKKLAETTASLENQKDAIEQQVRERTLELSEALNRAKAADQAKTDFLANMSHEIRTPMTAILGYADLLQNEEQSNVKQVEETLDSINSNAKHLLTIIDDILDVSKLEAGQMKVEQIQTSPTNIINEVTSLIAKKAHEKGIKATAVYSSEMPETVCTDPTRLRQILLNLMGNALKFTEQGSVTIHATCDSKTERLLISVIDTGIGMRQEQVDEIAQFKAFSQADASTTRKFGGTGLGLKISNALASHLGEGIEIHSVEGVGSTFSFSINTGPLVGVKMITPDHINYISSQAEESQSDNPLPTPSASGTLDGMNILLAEDGPDNQRLIAFHLKKAGARVTICDNGLIAVETIEASSKSDLPDLILMDMQMPELDGYSATQRLREGGYTLPIIALTAHAMDGDRKKCLDAGCDGYQTKPIDKIALINACKDMKQQSTHEQSPA